MQRHSSALQSMINAAVRKGFGTAMNNWLAKIISMIAELRQEFGQIRPCLMWGMAWDFRNFELIGDNQLEFFINLLFITNWRVVTLFRVGILMGKSIPLVLISIQNKTFLIEEFWWFYWKLVNSFELEQTQKMSTQFRMTTHHEGTYEWGHAVPVTFKLGYPDYWFPVADVPSSTLWLNMKPTSTLWTPQGCHVLFLGPSGWLQAMTFLCVSSVVSSSLRLCISTGSVRNRYFLQCHYILF